MLVCSKEIASRTGVYKSLIMKVTQVLQANRVINLPFCNCHLQLFANRIYFLVLKYFIFFQINFFIYFYIFLHAYIKKI